MLSEGLLLPCSYYSNLPFCPHWHSHFAAGCSWRHWPPSPLSPTTLWPWILTHPDFSELPGSKFLLQLEGFPGDLPGIFLPWLLRLGGHAGHCQLLAESITPLWNRAPGQPRAASSKLARDFPLEASMPGLLVSGQCSNGLPSGTFPTEQGMMRCHLCPPPQQA